MLRHVCDLLVRPARIVCQCHAACLASRVHTCVLLSLLSVLFPITAPGVVITARCCVIVLLLCVVIQLISIGHLRFSFLLHSQYVFCKHHCVRGTCIL